MVLYFPLLAAPLNISDFYLFAWALLLESSTIFSEVFLVIRMSRSWSGWKPVIMNTMLNQKDNVYADKQKTEDQNLSWNPRILFQTTMNR